MNAFWDWIVLNGLGLWFFVWHVIGLFLAGVVFGPKLVGKADSEIDTIGTPSTPAPTPAPKP